MCLIAFAIGASSRWPLVVASNRDEFFSRPALPLGEWRSGADRTIISGRDLVGGGTWLGATPAGRIAWLTNVRETNPHPAQTSRGELVLRWLEGSMTADTFMAQLGGSTYGGFNLVVGDLQSGSWTWLSNRRFDPTSPLPQVSADGWVSRPLKPGVYGLSNAALDTPWPKTLALKKVLDLTLQTASTEAALTAPLWKALANRDKARVANLPTTGLPVELELALSSAFVDEPQRGTGGYGTRCSTLLTAEINCLLPASDPCDFHQPLQWTVSLEERTHPSLKHKPPDYAGKPGTAKTVFRWHQNA